VTWLVEFVLLAAIWGASFLFMRGGAFEFGPIATAFLRTAFASFALLPIVMLRGHWPDFRKHARPVLLIGLLNSGIPFACFGFAVLHINTGLAGILNATTPMFGALIAWLALGDKLSAMRSFGLALGFAGVLLLAIDSAGVKAGGNVLWAVLACLLASLCYGIAASLAKTKLMGVPPLVAAAGSQVGAGLGLALPAIWLWPTVTPSAQAWGSVVALAVVCTAVAYLLYFRLIQSVGPAKALTVTYMIPVFAVLYGAVFLNERITLAMIGAGALVVLGTALATGVLGQPKASIK
jgi:drug/metabolite transporter (DMT)-like permease